MARPGGGRVGFAGELGDRLSDEAYGFREGGPTPWWDKGHSSILKPVLPFMQPRKEFFMTAGAQGLIDACKQAQSAEAILREMIQAREDWRNRKMGTTEYEIEINDGLNKALAMFSDQEAA